MEFAMKPEIKSQWVDALRSGDYKQGGGYLSINGTFCCLGVLCELAIKNGVDIAVDEVSDEVDGNGTYRRYDLESAYPPPSVVAWSGIPRPDPRVGPDGETDSLSGWNDGDTPFPEIADLIDQYL